MASTVFELQGKINLDTTGFFQALQSCMSAVHQFQSSVSSINNTVSGVNSSFVLMQHSIGSLGGSAGSASAEFQQLQTALRNAQQATQTAQMNVLNLTNAYNQSVQATGADSAQTQQLAQALQEARTALQNAQQAEQNASNALNDYARRAADAQRDTQQLSDQTQKAGNQFMNFGDILKANVIGSLIVDGIKNIIGLVKQLGDAAVKAVTDFTKSSIGVGMTFDSAMSQVAATMGMTMDDLQNQVGEVDLAWGHFSGNLRDFAKEMGKNTAFSATEAAQALNYMALAGYDAQKSMNMLPTVLNLAAAGGMQLANASDMITDTQTALGLSIDRTTQLVNEMAKTASKSNTSVEQLGAAMLTVGGNAKSLRGGMIKLEDGSVRTYDGITELNAAIGILADNGTKASEAGTKLRNILTSLSSDKFQTNITEQFGISAYDANGQMRALRDIFADINKATAKMTDQERTNLINDVFNARDKKDVIAFLDTTQDRWNSLTMQILDAGDAAQNMANTQLNNLTGNITIFKSALEGAQIAISDKLSPALSRFVRTGTQQLSSLTEVFEKEGLSGVIKNIPGYVDQWKDTFYDELSKIDTDKIEEIVGQIGYTIRDGIYNAIAKIPQGRMNFGKLIKELMEKITKNLPAVTNTIVKFIDKIGDSFQYGNGLTGSGTVGKFVNAIVKAIGKIGDAVVRNAPKVLKGVMSDLGDVVIDVFPDLEGIKNKIDENLGKIADSFSESYDKIKTAIEPIAEKISEFVSDEENVSTATDVISTAIDTLGTIISTAVGFIGDIVTAIKDFIMWVTGGSEGADSLVIAVGAAVTAIATFKTALMISSVVTAFTTGITAIITAISGLPAALAGISAFLAANPFAVAAAAVAALAIALVTLYNTNDDFKNFVDDWVDNWKVGEQELENWGATAYDKIQEFKDNWKTGWDELERFGGNVYDWFTGIGNSIIAFADSVVEGIDKIATKIADNPIFKGAKLVVQGVDNKVADWLGWGNKADTIQNGFSNGSGGASTASAGGVTINYTQNNTSPQALDEYTIWRQNQRAMDMMRMQLQGV